VFVVVGESKVNNPQVGLFAGIVSGFIIDARSDLQTDSNQNLLTGIRDALLQPPSAPDFDIAPSAKAINILWVLSLQLTLFSAVMGVLAKDWLEQFAPTSVTRDAGDACRRYRLDKQVELWNVELVIMPVPLFVQFASLLFMVGLVFRYLTHDRVVGYFLLATLVTGLLVYLVLSFLPMFIPSSPFRTPLYGIFAPVKKAVSTWWKRRNSESGDEDSDENEVLARILFDKLIKSPKSERVDEAAAEIAHPSFKSQWIGRSCQNETPRYLLSRFKRCAATKAHNSDERNMILRNHLIAFLQFVEYFDKGLASLSESDLKKRDDLFQNHRILLNALQKSLTPSHPIHRWNNLDEALRPLLFGLRAQILILLHALPQQYRPKTNDGPFVFDLDSGEMSDGPWELAFQDIHSQDRLYLMLSACRGVLQGQRNLKATSISIISLRLAKGLCLPRFLHATLTLLSL
jgi:hypothetical protein